MVDMAILGQAGFWNVNPMDMSVFFHLMAQQIPMLAEADGTVKAAMVGQTFEVTRLRWSEDGEEASGELDGSAEAKEADGYAFGEGGKAPE